MSTARLLSAREPQKVKRTLECELAEALGQVASERNRQLVARHLGWDGGLPCTLTEAGSQFQLTRERARQVYAAALPVLRQRTAVPVLEAVLTFVRRQQREPASEVEQRLAQQGLTAGGISLQAVLRAAQVFRCRPTFPLQRVGDTLFVGPIAVAARTILNAAVKTVAHHGAGRVSELRVQASRGNRRAVDDRLVRQILGTRADIRWLDDTGEWFWLELVPRNRLLARVRKVLAVCPRIEISKLHEAISRARLPLKLPEAMLLSICAQLPWCRVNGPCVESGAGAQAEDALAGAEVAVCALLKASRQALPFAKIEELCVSNGVKKANLWRIVRFSPLIECPSKGMYRLVGADGR